MSGYTGAADNESSGGVLGRSRRAANHCDVTSTSVRESAAPGGPEDAEHDDWLAGRS